MKIVFLGNFNVPFSTESHHKWTWEKMGHTVVALQEGKATTDEVVAACNGADICQITHTHGWQTRGSFTPEGMVERIKQLGVPTFSYHLDYYHVLNIWDKRDERVGRTWDWKVDHFFSTDGGHEEFFKSRGVNHHWLPPAVVEYGCYTGKKTPQFTVDVAFAGSVNYHPEYPFRKQLIEGLTKRYGHRFKVFQGQREGPLNDLYASVKVVVGDHVFAGTPKYWSDRCPETAGRGGFIIYPRTEGLTIPVATYEPQNIDDLCTKINYYLTNDEEREALRLRCQAHVKERDTYTNRLAEILRIVRREN